MYSDILRKYSQNMWHILKLILEGGPVTRSDLVEASGLSMISLTKYITQFIDDGIVKETGLSNSTGGRKPALLEIDPGYGYIIGIDVGAHSVKAGLVGLNGRIVKKEIIYPNDHSQPFLHYTPGELAGMIEVIINENASLNILGISIGISGLVDRKANKIIFCPNISDWNNVDLKEIFEERFGMPVFVDTSARCLIRAEKRFGIAKNEDNAVYLSLGCGIAAGIMANGQIYEGDGFAGEIGHIKVAEGDNNRCTCGNPHCLELYATLPMISERIRKELTGYSGYSPAKDILAKGYSVENLKEAASSGDRVVLSILDDIALMTGSALAVMANILNPSLIILGGSVPEAFPMLCDSIYQVIRKRSLLTSYRNLEVKNSMFGWEGGILGSATRIINMIFNSH